MGDKQYKTNNYTDFFYYAFRNILIISIPLVIISALVLSLPHSSAEVSSSSSDNVSFTLSTSCTIRGEVISAHTANLNGGQVVEDVGNTKLNAYCNDNNGYSIYAIGSSNDIDGNTDLISSINDNYNVHTGIYDSNTVSPSTPSSWAMKLTAGVGTNPNPTVPTIENNYNTYKEIPSTYTLVAKRTSKTDMDLDTTLSGSYINTTYQIYASSIQPAGTYTGKVKYVMLHPSINNSNITIDYAFALKGKERHGLYYAMQDMTTEICNMVNVYDEASQTQLVDIRDEKSYWVSKLQDGHCWMTQNLDLDLVTYINEQGQEVMKPLTSNDTDLTDHSLSGAYASGYSYDANTGVATWVPVANAKTIDFEGTTVNSWQDSQTAPSSANKTDGTDTGHGSLGNYYNWSAAIASNDNSSIANNNNANNSICPKNWRLPNIANNEFKTLNNLYNNGSTTSSTNLTESPLYYTKNGFIEHHTRILETQQGQGTYSSSTAWSPYDNRYLYFDDNKVSTSGECYYCVTKARGLAVRCLAR